MASREQHSDIRYHSGARAAAREPGTYEHRPGLRFEKFVFMVSGPGPSGPSRNDALTFSDNGSASTSTRSLGMPDIRAARSRCFVAKL